MSEKCKKHLEPVPSDRKAWAPYNFVELPDYVVPAEALPRHNSYDSTRQTGHITCTLTTASPLYVRCALTQEQVEAEVEAKDQPDFFFTDPQQREPVIPGSSLRGMLRTLVEIASYGKMDRVTDKKLFYRSLADPATKDIYTSNFVRERRGHVPPHPPASCYESKIRTGFLRKHGASYVIEECGYGRVDTKTYRNKIYTGKPPNRIPDWSYQNKKVYVNIEAHSQDHFFPRQVNPKNNRQRHPNLYLHYRSVIDMKDDPVPESHHPATLVITGDMQFKYLEFVFLHEKLAEYHVPPDLVQRFHDDDQTSQWQEKAFPEDKPEKNSRPKNGGLRDGEPVFFLLNDDHTVRFFGRAQMFRLPYSLSPRDFVPKHIREPDDNQEQPVTDIAEAMFGHVSRHSNDDPRKPIAGRVFISDACLADGQDKSAVWWHNEPFHPHILASPKPTTFQHYLTQEHSNTRELHHYASTPGEETCIRGHKLYWHKGEVNLDAIREADQEKIARAPKQYTRFSPVKPNTKFEFTIRFENLSRVELGALLWVLDIASKDCYRLKLGMGKPLGMGSVGINHTVTLSDRLARYTSLFDGEQWATGEHTATSNEQIDWIEAFARYICNPPERQPAREAFENQRRIKMLQAMLSWPGPFLDQTQYMNLDNFRQRPILPSPLQVVPAFNTGREPEPRPTEQATPAQSAATARAPGKPPRSGKPQSRLPQAGEIFRGKIVRIVKKTEEVELELPESFEDSSGITVPISFALREQTLVVIPKQHKTGGGYKVGNTRWVEVTSTQNDGAVLEVKPAKKPE